MAPPTQPLPLPTTLPLLRDLPPLQAAELLGCGTWRSTREGDELATEGAAPDALWLLPSGRVRSSAGLIELPDGGVVGEAALVGARRWRSTVRLAGDHRAFRIALRDLPESGPARRGVVDLVLRRLVGLLLAQPTSTARAEAPPAKPRQGTPGRGLRLALQSAGLHSLFQGAAGAPIGRCVEQTHARRGSIALQGGLALVLDGAVERATGPAHAETLGPGNWIGVVPRLAAGGALQRFVARGGTRLLVVPQPLVHQLWDGRAGGQPFPELLGHGVLQRLEAGRLRAASAGAVPRSSGAPAATMTTALTASGAHAGAAAPLLRAG